MSDVEKQGDDVNVQATNNSTAVGKIEVGGSIGGNVNIGGTQSNTTIHIYNASAEAVQPDLLTGEKIDILYFEPETVLIPAGIFTMGTDAGEGIEAYETPAHPVDLPIYRIGKYPVTNAQYYEFVQETERDVNSAMVGWDGRQVVSGRENFAVSGVSWYDAMAYCDWLTSKTGGKRKYTLPNEAQWEKACRAGRNFAYPWGEAFDAGRCNYGNQQLAAVDAFPAQNEFGCHDLVGNVLQWTCSLWGEKSVFPEPKYNYPWKPGVRNDPGANSQIRRILRGSSMAGANEFSCRCSIRSGLKPGDVGIAGGRPGFRVVMNF